ncbi:MAG: ATP-binding cassette domain-containing protein [Candidatus Eisenbacteria bacterium]|nr:ATP-binding cassette domain-containing protein [Candidatus Eisenbacteria bacterium]
MIALQAIDKSFGDQTVIRDLDLCVERGQTLVLIGPSGCGKSTLLRLILGLYRPDAGSVVFDGRALEHQDLRQVRRRCGYVIQDGGLFPHLTAAGNITLMARQVGWPAERVRTRLATLSEMTRFPTDGLARYPVELSGGQQQRVALMRALMLDPDVLLFDEPLGALDPMVRYELQEDLRRIFRELHKTTVLVTHDLAEAGYFGDRLVLMREGRIVQDGRFEQILRHPADAFVARFFQAQRGHRPDLAGGETATSPTAGARD